MASSSSASHQLVNVLNHSCLSMSFTTLNKILKTIVGHAIEEAHMIVLRPHTLTYDNINLTGSIYTEKTPGGMSKVQSETFAMIYEMPSTQTEDMEVELMMEKLIKAFPLTISDLQPSQSSMQFYAQQSTINICKVLCKYVECFATYWQHPCLHNIPH
jgi:hypothetical protein